MENSCKVGVFQSYDQANRRVTPCASLLSLLRQAEPVTPRDSAVFVRELQLARARRVPNGAGHVPAGEPEPLELVVWDEFLDQRKELSLLKPDVCVKQLPRRIQRLSIDDAGRHGDVEFASERFELHVLDACLAEWSRLRLDVSEEEREELFFLSPKVDTLVVPEELHEFSGRREPSRSIAVRGSTAKADCLHESIVMVARERDQGGVALHSTTLGYGVIPAVLGELHSSSTRLRPRRPPFHSSNQTWAAQSVGVNSRTAT